MSRLTSPHSDDIRSSCPMARRRFRAAARSTQLRAMRDRQGHGLFQEQMPIRFEHGPRHLVVQVRWQDDVDRVDVFALDKLAIVGQNVGRRMVGRGLLPARLGAAANRHELSVLDRGDRPGVMAPPTPSPRVRCEISGHARFLLLSFVFEK